mgnify:CR=1 FL=1
MVVQLESLSLRLQVTGMEFIEIEGQKQEPVIGRACGQMVKASTLLFKKKKDALIRIQGGSSSGNSRLFERGFNFQAMGIGGLDKEFADIVEICQQQGYITVKDMIREFGVTRYHANKVLNDLCEEPAARMYATKEGPITLYRLWKKE